MGEPAVIVAFAPIPEEIEFLRTTKTTKAGPKMRGAKPRSLRTLYVGAQSGPNGRMRLRIGGVDLLGTSDDPWLSVPIVIAATSLILCLRRAVGCGYCTFALDDGTARVQFVPTGREGSAATNDLLAAGVAFGDEVRHYLMRELLGLAEHEQYGPWFTGGADFLHEW